MAQKIIYDADSLKEMADSFEEASSNFTDLVGGFREGGTPSFGLLLSWLYPAYSAAKQHTVAYGENMSALFSVLSRKVDDAVATMDATEQENLDRANKTLRKMDDIDMTIHQGSAADTDLGGDAGNTGNASSSNNGGGAGSNAGGGGGGGSTGGGGQGGGTGDGEPDYETVQGGNIDTSGMNAGGAGGSGNANGSGNGGGSNAGQNAAAGGNAYAGVNNSGSAGNLGSAGNAGSSGNPGGQDGWGSGGLAPGGVDISGGSHGGDGSAGAGGAGGDAFDGGLNIDFDRETGMVDVDADGNGKVDATLALDEDQQARLSFGRDDQGRYMSVDFDHDGDVDFTSRPDGGAGGAGIDGGTDGGGASDAVGTQPVDAEEQAMNEAWEHIASEDPLGRSAEELRQQFEDRDIVDWSVDDDDMTPMPISQGAAGTAARSSSAQGGDSWITL